MTFPTGGQNLMVASNQWAMRPADERFESVPKLREYLAHRTELAREIIRPTKELRAVAVGSDVRLAGTKGDAQMTHYAFNQIAGIAGLSGEALRNAYTAFESKEQCATWIAEGLNKALEGRVKRIESLQELTGKEGRTSAHLNLLLQMANGGPLTLRAATTDQYSRIWDLNVVDQLLQPLVDAGFTNPPAYDGPAGLYASDRDMFAFLAPINVRRIGLPTVRSDDPSLGGFDIGGQQFYPFIITGQSEVGGQSAWFQGGLLQAICGNHIIWGARDVVKFSLRHVGEKGAAWNKLQTAFLKYVEEWVKAGTLGERQALQTALEFFVAKDGLGTVEFLRGRGWSKKASEAAVATIVEGDKRNGLHDDNPTRLFNIVAALTANNRTIEHQDARVAADAQASKLLALTGKGGSRN